MLTKKKISFEFVKCLHNVHNSPTSRNRVNLTKLDWNSYCLASFKEQKLILFYKTFTKISYWFLCGNLDIVDLKQRTQ